MHASAYEALAWYNSLLLEPWKGWLAGLGRVGSGGGPWKMKTALEESGS